MVAYLLGRGADVNASGFFAASALHWAAHNGHADTVALLVSRGANLTLEDEQFHATADDWAEEGGHPEIAERLHWVEAATAVRVGKVPRSRYFATSVFRFAA